MPVLAVGVIVVLGVVALLIGSLFYYWQITLPLAIIALLVAVLPRIIRHIRKRLYFASAAFLAAKEEVSTFVKEHNAVSGYATSLRESGEFTLGRSRTGEHAHLAQFENASIYNYRRDRNVAEHGLTNVHNCSLQIVRNASTDPLKYLMKYFHIKADEGHLSDVEDLSEKISRIEAAVANLKHREETIASRISPPEFVRNHYYDEFMRHVGVKLTPIEIPYPEYRFEYVSAGGNSSQRTTITLNSATIDALTVRMAEKVRFRKSVAGQRALMTTRLRESIKMRDNYSCQSCAVSVATEPHLLLEIDHIVPVSKGGLTTASNLQTLCWKCNRSKSNKMPADAS